MILIDTNVLSAVMRTIPDPAVVAWLDRQPPDSVWTTAITVFEIEMGIALLAEGKKRQRLRQLFETALGNEFDGKVLAFDAAAAAAAGALAADRERAGRTVDFRDTQIAGIAIARRSAIATRNTRHFQDLPVAVIDPWDD